MHVKFVLFVIFLAKITVTQCRNFTSDKVSVGLKKDVVKSSLVFVFDTTGSMFDDLRQLKEGAELILNAALEENSNIADFVFVPFHDPAVGPATITQDKQTFKNALNIVNVYGGLDCPEMSLGGILLALESSRPKSQVYVFTDATAKDHYKLPEVLDKLQQMQSQVVFVLTGHCNDLKRPSYQAYQKVAAASSGQVFNLNKTSVHSVLDFVRSSLKGRRVNLGSSKNAAGYNYTQKIPIDNTLGEVTVSVSGVKPKIKIINPQGEELTGLPKLIKVLDLSEIMIVKVIQPEPGNWSITVGSENDHSVKVVGLSNLTFTHGFSVERPQSMKQTSYRPLQGTYNHLLIHLTGPTSNVGLNYLEILTLDGKTLFEVPLHDFDKMHNVYSADAILPPEDMFYIAINGKDEFGQELRRIGSTAIQGILPEVPILTAPNKIEVKPHEPIVLECNVESLVPVTAMWTQYGRRIQPQKSSLQTTSIQYVVDNMKEEHSGTYTCFAKNVAGISTKDTEVVMIVDPPHITISPENVTTLPGSDIIISCNVHSDVYLSKFQLIFVGTTGRYATFDISSRSNSGVNAFERKLESVTEENQGSYTCLAANRGGQSAQTTYLTIITKPTVQILGPHTIAQLLHTPVKIPCKVENADVIIWKDADRVLKEVNVNNSTIDLLELDVIEDGVFTCVGQRGVYQESDSVTLNVLIKPQATIKGAKNITLLEGESMIVSCDVTAKPPPRIVWHKETEVFLNHITYSISPTHFNSEITINSTDDRQNRTYFCIAENSEGIGQDSVEVFVRRKMKLTKGFTDQTVEIYSPIELKCIVDSYPPSKITWYHNGTILNNYLTEKNTVLRLNKVDFENTGEYSCVASNVYEQLRLNGTLSLNGLESPLLSKQPSRKVTQEASTVIMSCSILKGKPPPKITWSYQNALNQSIILSNSSELAIPNVTLNHEGSYFCNAENIIGKDMYSIILIVQSPPKIVFGEEEEKKVVKKGEKIKLSCEADGKPKPQIVWYFDGQPMVYGTNRYLTDNNDLNIENLSEYDSGVYSCVASNLLGSHTKNFSVRVYDLPTISKSSQLNVDVLEGQLIELPCEVRAFPLPEVVWLHNGERIVGSRMYIDDFGIRFVANLTDFGEYTCLAKNEFGNDSISYNLHVWVPPSILPPLRTTVTTLLGSNVTLNCDAVGFPIPAMYWEVRGQVLTRNTSRVSFNNIGNMFINTVSRGDENVYACVAENIAGVSRKYIFLNVQEPPKIISDNYTGSYLATNKDNILVIPCHVTGKPRPYVLWSKGGFYLINDEHFDISLDGTLTIRQPTEDFSGEYICVAKNIHGVVNKTVFVQVFSIPTNIQSEESRTTVKAVEGTDLNITCPLKILHENDTVKWYKDAQLISTGNLTFSNITRNNASSYACVSNNLAYSTHTIIDLVVEWRPKFKYNENSTKEAVKGEDVYMDCECDSNPISRVKWYLNSSLLRGEDKHKLKLTDVQLKQSGIYKCVVSNAHGSISREFHLEVLVRPYISVFDELEVELKEGVEATLECKSKGYPTPDVKWTFSNTNWQIKNESLTSNITAYSGGVFRCDATNKAGRAHIVYKVNVISDAKITEIVIFENGKSRTVESKAEVVIGKRVRIACYASGRPTPKLQWIRNGIILNVEKRINHENTTLHLGQTNVIPYVDLIIDGVKSVNSGEYTCVATNEGGTDEKKVLLSVLEPPKILKNFNNPETNVTQIEVITGLTFYLHCHPFGNPLPSIYWFKDGVPLRLFDNTMTSSEFGEMIVSPKALEEQAGNYTCIARNSVGNSSVVYIVDVLVPPPPLKDNFKTTTARLSKSLNLTCPVQGFPLPIVTWIKQPYLELSDSGRIKMIDDNYTLIINNTQISDSGNYTCIMTNKVGTNEFTFNVIIEQAPSIASNVGDKNVETQVVMLKRSVVLKCEVDGHPTPKITWLKDTQPIPESSSHIQHIQSNSVYVIWSVEVKHASHYICMAENPAGVAYRRFNVIVKVPGKYSVWSKWSLCNVTCGLGYQQRNRVCQYIDEFNNTIDGTTNSDKIELDVSTCIGNDKDRRKCHMPSCEEETDFNWSPWSKWSKCSVTCGIGTQGRARKCAAGVTCHGDNVQIRKCPSLKECPKIMSSEENEVFSNEDDDKQSIYIPEATFEMPPEAEYVPPDVRQVYDPTEITNSPNYFNVNVTQNLDGSKRGPCNFGFKYDKDTKSCNDLDECQLTNNKCHKTQICVNTAGGYRCGCEPGYAALGAGQRCLDINECVRGMHLCEFACVNVAGGYVCACPGNLRLHVDKHHCVIPSAYQKPLHTFTNEERWRK